MCKCGSYNLYYDDYDEMSANEHIRKYHLVLQKEAAILLLPIILQTKALNSPNLMYILFLSRYNVVVIIVSYIVPIIILIITYTRVGIELWGSRAIGENTPVQFARVQSKRRVSNILLFLANLQFYAIFNFLAKMVIQKVDSKLGQQCVC